MESVADPTVAVSHTEVVDAVNTQESQPVLRLRLKKPKSDRKVGWRADTVDNEHMGKKKSKCCCIYKKPVVFGESSSEDDEDCEHCYGHPEKRRKNKRKHTHKDNGDVGDNGDHNSDDDPHGNDDAGPTCSFKPSAGGGTPPTVSTANGTD